MKKSKITEIAYKAFKSIPVALSLLPVIILWMAQMLMILACITASLISISHLISGNFLDFHISLISAIIPLVVIYAIHFIITRTMQKKHTGGGV